jgi:hypothetical protein
MNAFVRIHIIQESVNVVITILEIFYSLQEA